jgi:hypothetical protein
VQVLKSKMNGMRFLEPGVTSNSRMAKSPSPTMIHNHSPSFKIDQSRSVLWDTMVGLSIRGSSGCHVSQNNDWFWSANFLKHFQAHLAW